MKKEAAEAAYKFNPIIRLDPQIRQRPGQSFKQPNDPPTCHATTSTTDQHASSTGKPVACPVDQGSNWIQLVAVFQFPVVIFQVIVVMYRMAREVSALENLFFADFACRK